MENPAPYHIVSFNFGERTRLWASNSGWFDYNRFAAECIDSVDSVVSDSSFSWGEGYNQTGGNQVH